MTARWKNRTPGTQDSELDVLKDVRDLLLLIAVRQNAKSDSLAGLVKFLQERREEVE